MDLRTKLLQAVNLKRAEETTTLLRDLAEEVITTHGGDSTKHWWWNPGSWGGIVLSGPAVWASGQMSIDIYSPEWSDGGAWLIAEQD